MNKPTIGRAEFIALMGMLFAIIAFSTDAMLPSFPEIGAELSPDDVNKAQLMVMVFILGMGVGTFVVGPLSDAYGRRPILIMFAVLYMAGAVMGGLGNTLETVLFARFIQGVGAAGPRIVGLAIVRDLFKGREMAQVISFVMMVFALVPALAPSLGAAISALGSWRYVFASFVVFSLISTAWYATRLPETLPKDQRVPLRARTIVVAVREVFSIPMVRLSIMAQTLCMAVLFAMIGSTQQIMDITYDQGEHFHLWFGLVAIVVAPSGFLNARLVMRLGMRRMASYAVVMQVALSLATIVILSLGVLPDTYGFAYYLIWQGSIFLMVGLTLGNLTTLAMEPLGHIAGLAGSVIVSISTVVSVVFAIPIGLAFNGTALPLAIGAFICASLALVVIRRMATLERVVVPAPDH